MADDFTERYGDLLTGSYDCVDRIVLNAYYPMGNTAGGFRTWWRRLIGGSDAEADAVLDNTHLMRLAGRFARRVRAWAADNAVPVIDCTAGERKHLVAEEYLRTHSVGPGVFLILVARAPAMVWDVRRSADGTVIGNLARKRTYVNHYSFHIMDRQWGHLTIKMAGHAPFAAQVILNGHEYVAIAAQGEGIGFVKEGNCFTEITDPAGGPDRRHLAAGCGCRAAGPGLRPVDLHRVPDLRPGPGRPAADLLQLRLLGLPGRILP